MAVFIFILGSAAGYFYGPKIRPQSETPVQKDTYLAFFEETYGKIKDNYWEKLTDEQLVSLYVLGIEKLTGQPQVLNKNDKTNLQKLIDEINQRLGDNEKKKEFITKLTGLVAANLKPAGRSQLYTQKEEKELKDAVDNVNPETGQKEPTVLAKLVRPGILHLRLTKLSPTTYEELVAQTEKFDEQKSLDTLILDLRDNIGGSVDLLPYLLGPFIGQDQYAYQFFHQGEKTDYKTRIGWLPSLVRYKKVVVLVNENTQSSAEVMAAVLKKYNVGIVLGAKTKGWGTIEKVFPLENQLDQNEKHSLFLVHSITLGDDGQPIEGRGVEPLIDAASPDWQSQLYDYFHYQDLADAIKEIISL